MKKIIVIVAASIAFTSCETKNTVEAKKIITEATLSQAEMQGPIESAFPGIDTPALFGGKDGFGQAFMGFITYQDFDMAMQFTSKESIDKFGADAILKKYKSFKFNYKLIRSSESVDGKYTILRYKTSEVATRVLKDFKVVVENDSCKLVLPDNLNDFLK